MYHTSHSYQRQPLDSFSGEVISACAELMATLKIMRYVIATHGDRWHRIAEFLNDYILNEPLELIVWRGEVLIQYARGVGVSR